MKPPDVFLTIGPRQFTGEFRRPAFLFVRANSMRILDGSRVCTDQMQPQISAAARRAS